MHLDPPVGNTSLCYSRNFSQRNKRPPPPQPPRPPAAVTGRCSPIPGPRQELTPPHTQSQSKPNLCKALLALIWKNLRKTIMLFQQEAQSSPWRNNKSTVNISWVASHNLQGFFRDRANPAQEKRAHNGPSSHPMHPPSLPSGSTTQLQGGTAST